MSDNVGSEEVIEVSALQAEVRALRERLAQREQALAILNRRLMHLERGENGIAGMVRAASDPASDTRDERSSDVEELRRSHEALEQELVALHNTKVFRWTAPGRKVYGLLRRRP